MRGRAGIWTATFVSFVAAVLVMVGVPTESLARADASSAVIRAVPLLSSYETANRSVSRDIGISVALPDGHDLWLFGDTGIFERTGGEWKATGFIDGSTALQARRKRGQVPRGGDYPSGVPARFLPVPKNVYLPDGSGRQCNNKTAAFAARWPTGAAVMPTSKSHVLITYGEVCITHPPEGGSSIRGEGWGYLLYNWRHRRIDRGPVDVFAPQRNGAEIAPDQIFGSPQFDKGQLTLFTSRCTNFYVACKRGKVWSVTLPATKRALGRRASYRKVPMLTDGSGQWEPLAISVGRYASGLRLIETTSIGGTYKIFSAPRPGARWHLDQAGTLPGCPPRTGFCSALEGHPELSTSANIFVSYMDPDSEPGGHLVISAIPDRHRAR